MSWLRDLWRLLSSCRETVMVRTDGDRTFLVVQRFGREDVTEIPKGAVLVIER